MARTQGRTSLALFVVAAVAHASGAPKVDFYRSGNSSCEDILRFGFPELCPLEVSRGHITVRGLRLAYWRYRSQTSSRHGLPIVVVHGGPVLGHDYMLPLKQQACRGREVLFYDQVGSGASAIPPDVRKTAPWLLTIDYYVEELTELVGALGWPAFHFLGHSWGTVIGQAFALTRDSRLRGIVLSGPVSDAQVFIQGQWDPRTGSMGLLPLYMQHLIRQVDTAGGHQSPLYDAEVMALVSYFTCRTTPVPDCFLKCLGNMQVGASRDIYQGLQGSSDITLGGVLGAFNLTGQLRHIPNPVLLTFGKYDTMRPATVDAFYRNLPQSWKALMPHSGHLTMLDDPKLMNDVVGEFLDRVESGGLQSLGTWITESLEASNGGSSNSIYMSETPAATWARFESVTWNALLVTIGAVVGVMVGRSLVPRCSIVSTKASDLEVPFAQAA